MEKAFQIIKKLEDVQCAIIRSNSNRRYFLNFASSDGTLLVFEDKAYFLVDFRYYENAKKIITNPDISVIEVDNVIKTMLEIFKNHNVKKAAIESKDISVSQANRFKDRLKDIEIDCSDRLSEAIELIRSVKTDGEIAKIRESQRLVDQTFNYILPRIKPGRTEKEIALDMEFYMRSIGSMGIAFDTIVLSGKNSSVPHGVPSDKKIQENDFILMDFGAVVDFYCSDMTRTVCVGKASERQKEIYNIVLDANVQSIKGIAANKNCCDIDKIAKDIIGKAGYAQNFKHALGHSLGIDIHEDPRFSSSCNTKLQKNMVITVEPGIYIENEFGIRIEDLIVVGEDGVENLTQSPKNLLEL